MDFSAHLPSLSEPEFIQACINQQDWARRILYEEYYPTMMHIALRYAGNRDDALDIVHESFIKVFKNIHKYHTGTSLSAWMKTIVVNTCIDFYRKDIKNRTEDMEEARNIISFSPLIIDHLAAEEILLALQKLTPAYRSVFNLYVIEGYSHKEIADMLSINESTCRSNLVKARQKLKEYLLNRDKFILKTE